MDAKSIGELFEGISSTLETAVFNGIINLEEPLIGLLVLLATIGISTNWEMYFSSTWQFTNLIVKFLHIAFYIGLIRNWDTILNMCMETGVQLGLHAGGQNLTVTPGSIIVKGIDQTYSYVQSLWAMGGSWNPSTYVVVGMSAIICGFAIFAFLKIAYTLFMANMEFLVVGGLSMILLPFSMTKWTQNIADKTWGILLTSTVKILVANFMIALLMQFITGSMQIEGFNETTTFKMVEEKYLPQLISSTISIFFISLLIDKTVEYAGAMTNGLTIGHHDLVGPMTQRGWNMAKALPGKVYRTPGNIKRGAETVYSAGKATVNNAKRVGRWTRDKVKAVYGKIRG